MEKQETAKEAIQGWQKIIERSFNSHEIKDLPSLIEELEGEDRTDEKEVKTSEPSDKIPSDNKEDQSKEKIQETKSGQDFHHIESAFDAMSIEDVEEETLPTYRR